MAEVILENLSKRYGNVDAVRDVSLHVRDREFIVLVGPSGCGKSTTLRIVAGLEQATSGSVRIGNRRVDTLPPRDRDIAMVFQNYALYQHMSVYDNLAFGLRNRKTPEAVIGKEIARAAAILGIEPLLQRRPRELSGGQQQRVALGRCIVRNPSVFLFDEPLSNLDAQLRAQMRVELKELRQRVPTTSIFVTHDQVEAMTLGDRIVVMKDGLVQQEGTPLEVYRTPRSKFVAQFIGSPAMNFFPGSLVEGTDGLELEALGSRVALAAAQQAGLRRLAGQLVTVGLRPEHISLAGNPPAGTLRFASRVRVAEQMGVDQVLDVSVGDADIRVARVNPELALRRGDPLPLSAPGERLHFFDPETGNAL
ncbi:MAG: ABC transporter ATP-binding protein [SAR324 cluster bacterium]